MAEGVTGRGEAGAGAFEGAAGGFRVAGDGDAGAVRPEGEGRGAGTRAAGAAAPPVAAARSASSRVRSVANARAAWLFTVPGEISINSAICASERSS